MRIAAYVRTLPRKPRLASPSATPKKKKKGKLGSFKKTVALINAKRKKRSGLPYSTGKPPKANTVFPSFKEHPREGRALTGDGCLEHIR